MRHERERDDAAFRTRAGDVYERRARLAGDPRGVRRGNGGRTGAHHEDDRFGSAYEEPREGGEPRARGRSGETRPAAREEAVRFDERGRGAWASDPGREGTARWARRRDLDPASGSDRTPWRASDDDFAADFDQRDLPHWREDVDPLEYAGPDPYRGLHAGGTAPRERRHADYTGRGPRGYHRSDERLYEEVCDRLTDDPGVDATDVVVRVSAAEVTLEGTVGDREQKREAEDCAYGVPGVREVHNHLRLASAPGGRAPDDVTHGITPG